MVAATTEQLQPGAHDHLALALGDVTPERPVTVRVHSQCITGETFGSERCDCGPQLRAALHQMGASYVLLDTVIAEDVQATTQHEVAFAMLATLADRVLDLPREGLR